MRTAATQYVKITAHTSVTLNERADKLAVAAREDPDAPARSFQGWENYGCVYYYTAGDNGKLEPIRATAAELCTHSMILFNYGLLTC